MNNSMYSFTKRKLLGLLLLTGVAFQSQAAVISFNPSAQNVGLGDLASVDLMISDLGNDILTGFDLEISFDDTILAFNSFTVGPGPTELDPFGLDGGFFSYGFDLGFGTAAVGDLSLEFDSTLDGSDFLHPNGEQANSFVLGTLNFDTLSMGTSSLDYTFTLLGGALDSNFFVTELLAITEPGSITVSEPGILLLLITGLLGFGIQRKVKAVPVAA